VSRLNKNGGYGVYRRESRAGRPFLRNALKPRGDRKRSGNRRLPNSVFFGVMLMTLVQSTVPGPKLPKSIFNYEVIDYIGQGAGSVLYAVTDPKNQPDLRAEARAGENRKRTSATSSSSKPSSKWASPFPIAACAAPSK